MNAAARRISHEKMTDGGVCVEREMNLQHLHPDRMMLTVWASPVDENRRHMTENLFVHFWSGIFWQTFNNGQRFVKIFRSMTPIQAP